MNASIYDVQCSALPHAVQIPGRGSQVIPPTDFSGPNIFYSVDDIGTQVSVNMPCRFHAQLCVAPASRSSDTLVSNLSVSISSNAEAAEGGAPCPTTIPGQELCWYPFYVVSTLPVVDSTNSLSSNPWKAMYPQVLTQNNVDNSAGASRRSNICLQAHINACWMIRGSHRDTDTRVRTQHQQHQD